MGKFYNRSTENDKRRALRNNATRAEKMLWAKLRRQQINGVKFRRQFSIGPYILDFFSVDLKLAIELDGDSHFIGNGPTYDAGRQKYIEKDGIKIMRFTNTDINENIEGVIFLIQQATMGK